MRDWTKLLPASYNGIPFHVDGEEFSGGRRLVIHQTAGGEAPVIEDMGAAYSSFNVTAYLAGDLADVQANALIASTGVAGPGFLTLPIDGPQMVHVPDGGFRRARSKDRNGYVAVDLTFIPVAAAGGYAIGLGDVTVAFSTGRSAASIQFAGLF